jgi:hypothetical protein
MFGDSIYEEEERLRSASGNSDGNHSDGHDPEDELDVMAFGGLDEKLRLRQAISDLLREVGGC